MPHTCQLMSQRAQDVETDSVGHSSVHVLRPTLKFTREERYDLPLTHQTLTVSTLPQSQNGVEITATPPPSFSSFRISGLERDSKAQLIRRNMEYYETAEYRYTGPHADSSSSTFTTLVRENVRAGKLTAKTLVEDADTQSTASSQSSRRSRRSSALALPPSDRVLRPRPSRQKPDYLAREQRNTNYSLAELREEQTSARHRDAAGLADQALAARTTPATPIVRAVTDVAPTLNGDRYRRQTTTATEESTTIYRGGRLSSTTAASQYRLDAGDRPQPQYQRTSVSASSTWGQRLQTLWRPTVVNEDAMPSQSRRNEASSSQRNWVVSSMFGLGDSSRKGLERPSSEEFAVPKTSTSATDAARSATAFHSEGNHTGDSEGRLHNGGGGIIRRFATAVSSFILNAFAVIFVIAYCIWQCIGSACSSLSKLKSRFVSSWLAFVHLFRPVSATSSSSARFSTSRFPPSGNIYSNTYRSTTGHRRTPYSELDTSSTKLRRPVNGTVCCGSRSCCLLFWLPLLLALLLLIGFLLRPATEKLEAESEPQWFLGFLPSDAVCRRALPFHLYDQNSARSRASLRLHCLQQEYLSRVTILFAALHSRWSSLNWPTWTSHPVSPPVTEPAGSSNDFSILKAQLKSLNSDVGAKVIEISARLDRIDEQSLVITNSMARLRSESESRLADIESRTAVVSQPAPNNDSLLESAVALLKQEVAVLSSQLKQLREGRMPASAPDIAIEVIVDQLAKRAAFVSTAALESKLAEVKQQIASSSSQPVDSSLTDAEKTGFEAKLSRLSQAVTELQAALVQHRSDLTGQLERTKQEWESHRLSFDGQLAKSEKESEERIVTLRAELTTMTQKNTEEGISKLMAQLGSISEKVAAMEQLNHNLQAAIGGLKDEGKFGVNSDSDVIADLKLSTTEQIQAVEDRLKAAFSQQLTVNLREKILAELNSLDNEELSARLASIIKSTVTETLKKSLKELSPEFGGASLSSIGSAITAALTTYAADRTGLVDFALASAGGTVVNTRCTRSYNKGASAFSFLGIPLFYFRNSPNTILEPNNQPGECWAFEGAEGQAVIRLAAPAYITGVSLEHIPKSLSIHGHIDSAPREFQIKALDSEYDESGELLGTFKYDENGTPIQFFPIQPKDASKAVQFIELAVLNNYGNPEYTCIYRLRVHGSAAAAPERS